VETQVRRTDKGGMLPVYATYKNANTRVVTVLRQIDGDIEVRIRREQANQKGATSPARRNLPQPILLTKSIATVVREHRSWA